MDIIILPGNSQRNLSWANDMARVIADSGIGRPVVLEYDHWASGAEIIDFDTERHKLAALVTGSDQYIILAKSAGSLLAVEAIAKDQIKPARCVFLGFPMGFLRQADPEIEHMISALLLPVRIAQNERDPVGAYEDVHRYFDSLNNPNISVVVLPGDTHEYTDFKAVLNLI